MTVINTNIAETINIGQNGTYDVARYTTANVNVSSVLTIQKAKDANGKVVNTGTLIDLDGATDIGDYALYYAYYSNTNITGAIDLSTLIKISGQSACNTMFYMCSGITSVDLGSLTEISGSDACWAMFARTGVTNVDLSRLTKISGASGCREMFNRCTSLTSVDLSSLSSITNGGSGAYSMFNQCYGLTTLSFPALRVVYSKDVLQNLIGGVSGCTVHFPSNMSSYAFVIGGGTALYDLPATNLLTGINTTVYERNPKYDTGTALAWRVQDVGDTIDWTPFYTSGLTDPTVGTTIYSDAECTTAVTTVDSIA